MNNWKMKTHYSGEYVSKEDLILKRVPHDDKHSYKYPNHTYDIHYSKYANMDKGINLLKEHLDKNSKVSILVDVDVDGYTSSSILTMAIRNLSKCTIKDIHHTSKVHGLYDNIMNEIINSKCDLLIIPDAASNDIDEIMELSKYMDVLVIDHHDISNDMYYDEYLNIQSGVCLINNQATNNEDSNPHLTGAGLTLRFLEGLYNKLGIPMGYKYYDLAMLGLIGDMADYSDLEIRNIVFRGLENIESKLVKVILQDKINHSIDYKPMDIGFNVNPFINAVTRMGSMEDKHNIFKALSNNDIQTQHIMTKRYRENGKIREKWLSVDYYTFIYNDMQTIKKEQDKQVKTLEKQLYEELSDEGGIAVGLIDEEYKGITGLVANRISRNTRKPTLLLRDRENETELKGSARGNIRVIDDFKTWCQNTNLFTLAEGHDNAFGIGINKHNIDELIQRSMNVAASTEKIYTVDMIFDDNNFPSHKDIEEFYNLQYLTGGSVDELLLGFNKFTIDKRNIISYDSVTKIEMKHWRDNYEFIIFNDNKRTAAMLDQMFNPLVQVDIIGKPSKTCFRGKETIQVIVEDIQIHKEDNIISELPTKITKNIF